MSIMAMSKNILVIEDELDILKIIIFRLKKAGYKIMTAPGGQEALEILRETKPDLIVVDLVMPVVDGYEVCKRVRENKILKDIPILLLTASATTNMDEKVKFTKANDYLVKPFEPQDLLSKIKKLLRQE